MARPTRYDTEIKPHLAEIKDAVAAGATVEEIAAAFGFAPSTLYKYKKEKPELKEAFARGRKKVIFEIKGALLKKALGFTYEEEKRVGKKDKDGEKIVLVEKYTRYCPPSETAAGMLLRNYDPEWSDKDSATAELHKQEMDLKKAIADANNFDLDI